MCKKDKFDNLVLGHHGKESFYPEEQTRLRELFENCVDVFLCGHSHQFNYSSFHTAPHEIHQFTCGGGNIRHRSKLVFIHGEYDGLGHLLVTPYSYAENGDKNWEKDFRLHPKLSSDNNCFHFTRLNEGAVIGTGKPKNAAEKPLFDHSQKYYNQQTSPNGRFAYVPRKHDDMLLTKITPFETTAILERDNKENNESAKPKNVIHCVLDTDEHVLFIGDGGMGKTMSVLRVWQHELDSTEKNRKLPVYVPLNEFNTYEGSKIHL